MTFSAGQRDFTEGGASREGLDVLIFDLLRHIFLLLLMVSDSGHVGQREEKIMEQLTPQLVQQNLDGMVTLVSALPVNLLLGAFPLLRWYLCPLISWHGWSPQSWLHARVRDGEALVQGEWSC